ncbi:MAG: aromatic ring-hydroxylating dioxygenase subunit alpha [Pseudomonadota bacterium]|nr:aromatic ring-hydroxylating dioxygenase subunit alpha [Pseudomonadota bacterium]
MNRPGEARIVPQYPELGTRPISVEPMVSADYFARERETIFRHMWINLIMRAEDIPNPGDFFVRDIEVLGVSIIVVRGDDGVIRGFHNVCTHRGNRITHATCGNSNGFQCDFHGWTFARQGDLVHVTDEEQFLDFDKSEASLPPVHIDQWHGFLFANLDDEPAQTLEQSMAQFNADLGGFPFDEMICAGRYRYEVDANWKVTMNAFQEGYHVAFVHKRSAPDAFTGGENPYCHIPLIKLQPGGNQSLAVPANPGHALSPTEALAFKFGATFTQGTGNESSFPGTHKGEVENWGFDLNILFPFSRINVGAGWYYVDAFWPVDQGHTVYELAYYFPAPGKASAMVSQEFSKIVLRDLSREDLSTNEDTQKALNSGALRHIFLSEQEVAIRHLYRKVDERIHGHHEERTA